MTETTTVTITQEITIPVVPLETKKEVGEWMLEAGLTEWEGYNDYGNFEVKRIMDVGYHVYDPDNMEEPRLITFQAFFEEHFNLIWLGQIKNYRLDWREFALRQGPGDMDSYANYDAWTADAA